MEIFKLFFLFLIFASTDSFAEPDTSLRIHYVNRPPYTFAHPNGVPSGSVADPAIKVLKKAGIKHKWSQTPVNRQFKLIKDAQGLDCTVGMEQTPSRSEFAKFSEPLYIGQPVLAIMNLRVKANPGVTFSELLEKYAIFKISNASKLALYELIKYLESQGQAWMDIQMVTDVSGSFGGKLIPKDEFLDRIDR